MSANEVLTLLLGGGAVATIGALFQGIRSLQSGARARERETVDNLVEQRNEAWVDRDNAIDRADYWQQWAGTVEYLARQNGVELPLRPAEPKPKQYVKKDKK